jgi:hypothetical protein
MKRALPLLSLLLLPACAAAVVPVPLPAPSERSSYTAGGREPAAVTAMPGAPAIGPAEAS